MKRSKYEIEDVDWETVSLSLNPQFIDLIENSRARHKKEGGISSEEMRWRVGLGKQRASAVKTMGKKTTGKRKR